MIDLTSWFVLAVLQLPFPIIAKCQLGLLLAWCRCCSGDQLSHLFYHGTSTRSCKCARTQQDPEVTQSGRVLVQA